MLCRLKPSCKMKHNLKMKTFSDMPLTNAPVRLAVGKFN